MEASPTPVNYPLSLHDALPISGVITFLRPMPSTAQIAVGFTDKTGADKGLNEPINIPTSSLLPSNSANLRVPDDGKIDTGDRKSTRLNSSHPSISYAVFCLKKK